MTRLAAARRARERRARVYERAHSAHRKKRDVHRREQHRVALAAQVFKAYLHRVEHLRVLIVFVPEEDYPVPREMPLQLLRVAARHHHYPAYAGLLERGHNPLRYGY